MRIVHTADLHLKSTDDERWEALGALLETAEELKAGAMVLSGDTFDKHVEAQRLKTPLREVFEKRPFPIFILPGNHDEKGLRAGDFFGRNVTVLADGERVADVGMVHIVAMPYENIGPDAVLDRLLAARDQLRREEGVTNVLLYHGELLDLMPEPDAFGEEAGHDYMPVRLSTFSGLGFDYVLAGHFHKSYDVHQFDGGYFVYPGSPVSITRKETGRRYAVVIDPGEPPRPVSLQTAHAEAVEVIIKPFDRVAPVDEIRRRLDLLPAGAAAYLTVGGFADVEAMGTTERALDESIRGFESDPRVAEVDRRWRDVGEILQHELFRRVDEQLKQARLTDEEKEAVREMVIDSMTEAIHAD